MWIAGDLPKHNRLQRLEIMPFELTKFGIGNNTERHELTRAYQRRSLIISTPGENIFRCRSCQFWYLRDQEGPRAECKDHESICPDRAKSILEGRSAGREPQEARWHKTNSCTS